MKDKIIMLIVGIIIGAVLAGACFWFATSGVRIDIWTHFMRGCIIELCTPI